MNCIEKCATKCRPYAAIPLRLALGIGFMMHGLQKLGAIDGTNIDKVSGFFGSLGFAPATFWAWVVALVETIGGAMVLIGLWTPIAAMLLAIVMLVAILRVHISNGFFVGVGGIELAFANLMMALSLKGLGAGPWSVDAMMKKDTATTSAPISQPTVK
jgi:putative oxidoreductase